MVQRDPIIHSVEPCYRGTIPGSWEHTSEGGTEFVHQWEPAYTVDVFVAGFPRGAHLDDYCRKCVTKGTQDVGLCVTVEEVVFAHKDGSDRGYRVGVRNYPRFPKTRRQILDHAVRIAELLVEKLDQDTALVDAPDATIWVRRKTKLEDAKC